VHQPDELAWVALSLQPHIGSKTLSQLLSHFGSASAVLAADVASLRHVRGVGPKLADAITRIDRERVAGQCEHWTRSGVQIVPHYHAHYPSCLRQLDDAPATIFVKGEVLVSLPQKAVALIGTRQPGDTARAAAYRVGQLLAQTGYMVVSGMALGIDATAHAGALSTHSDAPVTIGVLGSGVLRPYPAQHRSMAQQIIVRGALVSECAPDVTPNAPRLVSRNRLITGLATSGVIVLETSTDGGAMHAARFAQAQGRPLYTLDLPTSGNQALIQAGAVPLSATIDSLDFLQPQR
jgi:DNA processing protein